MRKLLISVVVYIFLLHFAYSKVEGRGNIRDGKVLSLFSIVRFPNDPCVTRSKNGTCYTADECETRGGTNGGTCAQGYGVCCTFTVTCGQTSSENCTYFESTGSEIGACQVEICKADDNVCQLRLDFEQFMITGPSTDTTSNSGLKLLNGKLNEGGASVSTASQCLTDMFSVGNPGGAANPMICGLNSGEHMYVDASDCCNDLTFTLGQSGIFTSVTNRQWSIKVTQYSCDFPNLAPDGCTQYFFGSTSQTVQSYNFAGGQHLASQNQNVCVRRERGNCRICWRTGQLTDFMVSGASGAGGIVHSGTSTGMACCSHGGNGMLNPDCVLIHGALSAQSTTKQGFSRVCGRSNGLPGKTTGMNIGDATVCSDRVPFGFRFLTDEFETVGNHPDGAEVVTGKLNAGVKLIYTQNADNC